MQVLWKKLDAAGIEKLCTRNLNQDPIENLFGCICMQGVRNVNPTCSAFKNSLKTILVNNFMTENSPLANCEEDESEGSLNTLKEFLMYKQQKNDDNFFKYEFCKDESFIFYEPSQDFKNSNNISCWRLYCEKIFKITRVCSTCRNELVTNSNNSTSYIKFKYV